MIYENRNLQLLICDLSNQLLVDYYNKLPDQLENEKPEHRELYNYIYTGNDVYKKKPLTVVYDHLKRMLVDERSSKH